MIGVDFFLKSIVISNVHNILQIWNFSSENRFKFLLEVYILGAKGAILMYDITNPVSLENLPCWTQIIRKQTGDIPIMLIGSKKDLEELRAVSIEQGNLAVKKYNLTSFMEIFSKTGENVEEVFEALARLMIQKEDKKGKK